ncbi:hypothetical protein F5Y05DRAFT_411226 [Hypoxylon sp. FL0543]|nr:hypothetical protein F5Y05DRAFT_411226 [Hypoxylon sp. FL0543]
MSTPDNSSRNDGEGLIITLILRPSGSHVSPLPRRQFTLSHQNPTIRIGRASKAAAKGFVASIDNAWFDSPVMSRQHAELVLDRQSTQKVVYLKDIGSLHGTFHTPCDGIRKESRLEPYKVVKLSNGDSLRFGTDIFRGSETFPPCFVDFYMIEQDQEPHNQPSPIVHQPTNRVFTIPDDDIDDDDDEDDDSVIETTMLPSQELGNQRGPSIDLTRDDTDEPGDQIYRSGAASHKTLDSDVIDLTSEPSENSDHEPAGMRRHSSASFPTTAPVLPPWATASATYQSILPTDTDHSQKPMKLQVEPDRSSDHDIYLHRHDEEMSNDDIQLTDSENCSIATRDSFDDPSDTGEIDDDDEDEEDSLMSDSRNGSRRGFKLWVGEDESLEDLPSSDDDSSYSSEESLNLISNSSSPAPGSSLYSQPIPLERKEAISDGGSVEALADSSETTRSFVTPFLFTAAAENDGEIAHPREPSPSDAAMFKSRPLLDRTPSHSRAQALGEKSGKYEFFAARESNRTTLPEQISPLPTSTIRENPGENSDRPVVGPEAEFDSSPVLPIVRVDDSHTKSKEALNTKNTASKVSPVDLAAPLFDPTWAPLPEPPCQTWSVSGEKFINNPRNEDLPYQYVERPSSPELDMTSAYTFQLSKLATESSASRKSRRVGIEDLLTREPHGTRIDTHSVEHSMTAAPAPMATVPTATHSSREHSLKRSFEDAFTDGHIELDVRPSLDEAHTHVNKTEPESTSHQCQGAAVFGTESIRVPECRVPLPSPPPDAADVAPVTMHTHSDMGQPSKRRRFAQAAACVALGGAAAFTFMVSTAPVL